MNYSRTCLRCNKNVNPDEKHSIDDCINYVKKQKDNLILVLKNLEKDKERLSKENKINIESYQYIKELKNFFKNLPDNARICLDQRIRYWGNILEFKLTESYDTYVGDIVYILEINV